MRQVAVTAFRAPAVGGGRYDDGVRRGSSLPSQPPLPPAAPAAPRSPAFASRRRPTRCAVAISHLLKEDLNQVVKGQVVAALKCSVPQEIFEISALPHKIFEITTLDRFESLYCDCITIEKANTNKKHGI
jgi:hypothetical protein